jgi:digeranylgeranylglycerophospholipid reductase
MDVIVVGAGPAGSMAAEAVAKRGYEVTVYEKGPLRREKPCGGGVSDRVEEEFNLNPGDDFWDRPCRGIFLCSPKNKTVVLTEEEQGGYLVMREKFDYYLVERARKAGIHFVENTRVEPYVKHGKVAGVKTGGEVIESDIVIACDGTPSSCARALGMYNGNEYNQASTYQYQMKMDNKEIDEKIGNNMEIYFGHTWMPYGYSWIFPKKGIVTVGCGTWLYALRNHKVNVKNCLDKFIKEHPVASQKLGNAETLYPQSAMIGFSSIADPIYLDNFMVAGDAAGFVSVPTGEGIYYSMVSGRIAGEVAAEALDLKDTSSKVLKRYKKRTKKKMGADMKWGYWLRRLVMDKERNQENLVKISLKDDWVYNMTGKLIGGDIGYREFLIRYLLRPDKLLKLIAG